MAQRVYRRRETSLQPRYRATVAQRVSRNGVGISNDSRLSVDDELLLRPSDKPGPMTGNLDFSISASLVLHAWKSPAMFLRLAPTLDHDCLSLRIRQQQELPLLQLLTSIGPVSMMELSEAKRLRGRGLGLGSGALPPLLLLLTHSGNWKVASLIGLLGTETVTWGGGS